VDANLTNDLGRSGGSWRAQLVVAGLMILFGFMYSAVFAEAAGVVAWLFPLLFAAAGLGVTMARFDKWQEEAGGRRFGTAAIVVAAVGVIVVVRKLSEAALFWVFLFAFAMGIAWVIIGVRHMREERRAQRS